MSFDEEWRQLQADAAARRTAMRLNRLDGGGGGGGPDLSARSDELGLVGNNAYTLHGRLDKDGNHAQKATSDAAAALSRENFRTGDALQVVHDNWESQLRTLLAACAHISNHLDYTAARHEEDEKKISASMSVSRISEFFK